MNLHKQDEFIWSKDPDKNNPEKATVVTYRPLDGYEQAYLQDRVSQIEVIGGKAGMKPEEMLANSTTRTEVHKVAYDALRIAATGITNLLEDDNKTPVPFATESANIAGQQKEVVAMEIVRRIPVGFALEFWSNLMSKNSVDADTEKNSDAASSPSNSLTSTTAKGAPKTSAAFEVTRVSQS
jgi:hypothetical protein